MYEPGTVIGGKYRVDHVLGVGGMGTVAAATHLQLGSRLALKFLHADMAQHPTIVERFLREARASAQLQSDNVCRVTDVGQLDSGIPYIVMELLQGRDLASVLRGGPTPPAVVAEWLMQVCQGLAEAHAIGIVHRDLKPGNLFLVQRPNGKQLVKVLDFGIAKTLTADFNLTQTTSMMGSPGYMSPEQLKSSRAVDPRADIWSLGIVIYELLTATKPFDGETITELALKVVGEPHIPLPATLPRQISDVVQRCLEKDPARRYQNVAELAVALAPLVPNGMELAQGVALSLGFSGAPVPASLPGPSVPTTLGSATGALDGKRSRVPIIVGLVAGVIGIGIAVIVMSNGDKSPTAIVPAAVAAPPVTTPPPPPPTPAPPPPPAPVPPPEPAAIAPIDAGVDAAPPKIVRPRPKANQDINDVRK